MTNSYSPKNGENMRSSLVTDAAVDAALAAIDETPPYEEVLHPVLAAVAPLIAAQALRLAARLVETGAIRPAGAEPMLHYSDLLRLAGQWEGK